MKKQYSKETYRLRELEIKLQIPLVTDYKEQACNLLREEYASQIEAYYNYKDVNREFKRVLNQLKKNYGRKVIGTFSKGIFENKKQVQEFEEYKALLEKRRVYNDDFKFIRPLVDEVALKIYKTIQPVKSSEELKEFLHLLKGLVVYTLKVFYKQPTLDTEFIENIYQSCYVAYIQNYDRSYKKVDTFITTHIINELSHITDKEIPVESFLKLDSTKPTSSCVLIKEFNNDIDRHLTWEFSRHVL